MTVGFIGCGNMASAMIFGMCTSRTLQPNEIMVFDIDKAHMNTMEQMGMRLAKDNKHLCKEADVIVLAVKPYHYPEVIEEIKDVVDAKKLVITIAAGRTLEDTQERFGTPIPIVRAMPNTPAFVNEGMSTLTPNDHVSEDNYKIAEKLFESFGRVEKVKEKDIHAVIAVSGSSPAYVYMMIEAMADGAVLQGMPRQQAYNMAAQAVLGAAKMVLDMDKHPGQLKDEVCSPGGTTIEAVASLEKNGFRHAIIEAMTVCADKSKALSKTK